MFYVFSLHFGNAPGFAVWDRCPLLDLIPSHFYLCLVSGFSLFEVGFSSTTLWLMFTQQILQIVLLWVALCSHVIKLNYRGEKVKTSKIIVQQFLDWWPEGWLVQADGLYFLIGVEHLFIQNFDAKDFFILIQNSVFENLVDGFNYWLIEECEFGEEIQEVRWPNLTVQVWYFGSNSIIVME